AGDAAPAARFRQRGQGRLVIRVPFRRMRQIDDVRRFLVENCPQCGGCLTHIRAEEPIWLAEERQFGGAEDVSGTLCFTFSDLPGFLARQGFQPKLTGGKEYDTNTIAPFLVQTDR